MTKKIKTLVQASYTNDHLDENSVQTVADHVDRRMLKQYIKLLKQEENKKVIFVTIAKPLTVEDREKLKALFPNKKVIENIDQAMISGIKIVQNDEEYEINLNRTFHDIMRLVSNND